MADKKITSLKIDWIWVAGELGRTERIRSEAVRSCAEGCLHLAKNLVKPKLARRLKNIEKISRSSIELSGRVTLSSSHLASHLKGARVLSFFLVTIGSGIEEKASELMANGDSLGGYLMDRIGSLAVESLAEGVESALRLERLKKDETVSMRFSPGYCSWTIEDQIKMAKILDFRKAGVRLTERCMMVPKKSISAACAIGPKGLFTRKKSQCAVCDLKQCDYRRG
jgi:hypothetical protein